MISLEKACLNVIVREFERFNSAFTLSTDQLLNRYLQFLQRKYTVELISQLSERKKLKDEYMDFLLNEHLEILNEDWFTNSRYRDSLQDIIYRLPNLTKIYLYDSCSDAVLEKVAEFCPKITIINALCSSITDAGLKHLCKTGNGKILCSVLRELYICSSSITDEGLMYLVQSLPSLEKISHNKLPHILYLIHKDNLHNLEKVATYNLVHLDLTGFIGSTYYDELLKICLTVCPRLKVLRCCITDRKQLDLLKNTNLEELDLRICKLNERLNIDNLLRNNGYNLFALSISKCMISVNVLAESCPKLQYLKTDNCFILCESVNSQLVFHSLTDCSLSFSIVKSNTFDIGMCLLLQSSPNLESFEFSSYLLSIESKNRILNSLKNKVLKNITFDYSSSLIDMVFVKDVLLSCTSLKTLTLIVSHMPLDDNKELNEFAKVLPNKPYVHLEFYQYGDDNDPFY